MTIPGLAKALGVSRQRIYQLLEGERPSLKVAVRLERVTGIPAAAWIAPERETDAKEK